MKSSRMHYFAGFTLVDITETGVTRDRGTDELKRNQQRNWETVIQCISLRTQPMEIVQQISHDAPMSDFEFGEMYSDRHTVWTFAFTVEHNDIFRKDDDPAGLLDDSFDTVPVITGLEETARFILPIFYTSGGIKNIYFKILPFELNKL
jgi:hypothetical protein